MIMQIHFHTLVNYFLIKKPITEIRKVIKINDPGRDPGLEGKML